MEKYRAIDRRKRIRNINGLNMQPVEFDRVNVIFKGNNPEVGDLPAFYDNKENVTWTCWQLTDEDLDNMDKTKLLWVHFTGSAIAPVGLSSESPFNDISKSSELKDALISGSIKPIMVGVGSNLMVIECDSDEYEYIARAYFKQREFESKEEYEIAFSMLLSNGNLFYLAIPNGLILVKKSNNEKTTSVTFESR